MTITLQKRSDASKSFLLALLVSAVVYFVSSVFSGTYINYNTYVNPINPADTGYVPGYKNVIDHAFTK